MYHVGALQLSCTFLFKDSSAFLPNSFESLSFGLLFKKHHDSRERGKGLQGTRQRTAGNEASVGKSAQGYVYMLTDTQPYVHSSVCVSLQHSWFIYAPSTIISTQLTLISALQCCTILVGLQMN